MPYVINMATCSGCGRTSNHCKCVRNGSDDVGGDHDSQTYEERQASDRDLAARAMDKGFRAYKSSAATIPDGNDKRESAGRDFKRPMMLASKAWRAGLKGDSATAADAFEEASRAHFAAAAKCIDANDTGSANAHRKAGEHCRQAAMAHDSYRNANQPDTQAPEGDAKVNRNRRQVRNVQDAPLDIPRIDYAALHLEQGGRSDLVANGNRRRTQAQAGQRPLEIPTINYNDVVAEHNRKGGNLALNAERMRQEQRLARTLNKMSDDDLDEDDEDDYEDDLVDNDDDMPDEGTMPSMNDGDDDHSFDQVKPQGGDKVRAGSRTGQGESDTDDGDGPRRKTKLTETQLPPYRFDGLNLDLSGTGPTADFDPEGSYKAAQDNLARLGVTNRRPNQRAVENALPIPTLDMVAVSQASRGGRRQGGQLFYNNQFNGGN